MSEWQTIDLGDWGEHDPLPYERKGLKQYVPQEYVTRGKKRKKGRRGRRDAKVVFGVGGRVTDGIESRRVAVLRRGARQLGKKEPGNG